MILHSSLSLFLSYRDSDTTTTTIVCIREVRIVQYWPIAVASFARYPAECEDKRRGQKNVVTTIDRKLNMFDLEAIRFETECRRKKKNCVEAVANAGCECRTKDEIKFSRLLPIHNITNSIVSKTRLQCSDQRVHNMCN